VPEIDTPAHSSSFCVGMPEICLQGGCNVSKTPAGKSSNATQTVGCEKNAPHSPLGSICEYGGFSLLDPSKPATFEALGKLFGELATVFEDNHVHIGT